MKRLSIDATAALVLGALLLLVNLIGLFRTMEEPDLLLDNRATFKGDKQLILAEVLPQADRKPGEDIETYFKRLNQLVNGSISHLWHSDDAKYRYHGHVPPWENYILWTLGYLWSERVGQYEFFDWRKAVERGIGLCSQHALVISGILEENGIESSIVGLEEHVVATAKTTNGDWWILDPDYGVVIPHDLQTLEQQPELVSEYYAPSILNCSPPLKTKTCQDVAYMAGIYQSTENNHIYPSGHTGYSWKWYLIEKVAYLLKWAIPLLLFGYTLFRFRQRRRLG